MSLPGSAAFRLSLVVFEPLKADVDGVADDECPQFLALLSGSLVGQKELLGSSATEKQVDGIDDTCSFR